jgi:hypothetical protein
MFTVQSSVTLVLDNNITLQGHSSNTASLVSVSNNGTLIMNNGSTITGNTYYNTGNYTGYGGVHVSRGTFIMNGGTISGNTAYLGGGVAMNGGTFTMNGGTISGNTSNSLGTIYLQGATFTMSGGTISGNVGSGVTSSGGAGVGVYGSSSFTMSGGTISNNTGEGVYIQTSGIFTKTGGTIIGSRTSNPTNGNGRYAVHAWYNTDPNGSGGTYIQTYKTPTSGPSDNLYYNSTTAPPTWSGAWDD